MSTFIPPMVDNNFSSHFEPTGVAEEDGCVPGKVVITIGPLKRKVAGGSVTYYTEVKNPELKELKYIYEGSKGKVEEPEVKGKKKGNVKQGIDWKQPFLIEKKDIPEEAWIYDMKQFTFGVPESTTIKFDITTHETLQENGEKIVKQYRYERRTFEVNSSLPSYRKPIITDELADAFINQWAPQNFAIFFYPLNKMNIYYDEVRNAKVGFNTWVHVERAEIKKKSKNTKNPRKVKGSIYIDGDDTKHLSAKKHYDALIAKTKSPRVNENPMLIYRVFIKEEYEKGKIRYWSYPLDIIYPWQFRMSTQPLNGKGKEGPDVEVTVDAPTKRGKGTPGAQGKEEEVTETEADDTNEGDDFDPVNSPAQTTTKSVEDIMADAVVPDSTCKDCGRLYNKAIGCKGCSSENEEEIRKEFANKPNQEDNSD